jgi:ribosomal protein S18 acetylase RimI-like enzyme
VGRSKLIKKYLNLNDIEKSLASDFINRKDDNKKSKDEIDKMFNNKMYGYGQGALFYFLDEKVVGKINVVLEVVKELGTIYIHFLDLLENLNNEDAVLKELIDYAVKIANDYDANEILLGIRDNDKIPILQRLGLYKDYSAINMYLEDREKKEICLDLIPLSQENKLEYLNIYNNSFSDMPHGSLTDISGVEDDLKKSNDENYYFIVSYNDSNIGFMSCVIENGEGVFDIGLCKDYRGKGYGKYLLETAIDFLNRKDAKKIRLIVIEKNSVAYNMYKKRGFKEESILSYWIKIK